MEEGGVPALPWYPNRAFLHSPSGPAGDRSSPELLCRLSPRPPTRGVPGEGIHESSTWWSISGTRAPAAQDTNPEQRQFGAQISCAEIAPGRLSKVPSLVALKWPPPLRVLEWASVAWAPFPSFFFERSAHSQVLAQTLGARLYQDRKNVATAKSPVMGHGKPTSSLCWGRAALRPSGHPLKRKRMKNSDPKLSGS